MHNFISMSISFSMFSSTTFYILCLYYCLVSVTLVGVADQIFYIYCKASFNIRTPFYMETIFLMSASMCACLRDESNIRNIRCYVMPVNTEQWRAGIGRFHGRILFSQKACFDSVMIFKCFFNFFYNSFLSILVLKAGDIELNSRPNKMSHSYFSCCHWNVNGWPTDNYCKVAALKAYNSVL